MWRILQRGFLPVLLLGAGIASLVQGVVYHQEEIFQEQEIEVDVMPPEFPPGLDESDEMAESEESTEEEELDESGEPGGPFGPGGPPDLFRPEMPPELRKVKQIVFVGAWEPEMVLVREVTFGGLARLESGELKRTYTGTPPSLCPT